ncbi:MAG: DNA polymerase III subunit delta [Oscillospiraceae bacterium]|nr:DNA polymerase III subunit delta [Oscillospiraceae bacterium]
MPLLTDTDLRASIKNGKIEKAYYFYGKDTAMTEHYLKFLLSKTLKKGDEVCNLHKFEGKDLELGALADACEALPLFADYVCVSVRDLNAESLNADDLKRLVSIVSDLPDSTVLIFSAASIDLNDGKKYPTAKNKKLLDAVSKAGAVCEFKYKTASALGGDIVKKVNRSGSVISKQAAEHLANLCGCDTMSVGNEIAKLLAYANGGEITIDMINMLTPRRLESTTFDLAKAAARRDGRTAIRLLGELTEQRVEPISVMYALTANMVDLYRARTAMASGKNANDVVNDFNYPKNLSFRVNNAFRDVRSFSASHLRECMKILTEADIAIKSLRTDKQVILEETVVKLVNS